MKPTITLPEVRRLKEVYRKYEETAAVQAKWSRSNPGNRIIVEERDALIEELLRRQGFLPLTRRRILDVGCGGGSILASFKRPGGIS